MKNVNRMHLTEEDMDRLYPDLTQREREEMKDAISVFTELFFGCVKKRIRHNELGESK